MQVTDEDLGESSRSISVDVEVSFRGHKYIKSITDDFKPILLLLLC